MVKTARRAAKGAVGAMAVVVMRAEVVAAAREGPLAAVRSVLVEVRSVVAAMAAAAMAAAVTAAVAAAMAVALVVGLPAAIRTAGRGR